MFALRSPTNLLLRFAPLGYTDSSQAHFVVIYQDLEFYLNSELVHYAPTLFYVH